MNIKINVESDVLDESRDIKERLGKYPTMTKAIKANVRAKRDICREYEEQLAIIESDIAMEIASETNPSNGKAAFSNAEARAAELVKRKSTNEDYQFTAKQVRAAQFNLEDAQDELARVQDEYRVDRIRASSTSSEMEFMAALLMSKEQPEEINGEQAY